MTRFFQVVLRKTLQDFQGNILRINNVSGVPKNRETIQLYNQRKNSTTVATGTKIGDARVYSCALTGNAYSGANSNWDLALFDVQTYTEITLDLKN